MSDPRCNCQNPDCPPGVRHVSMECPVHNDFPQPSRNDDGKPCGECHIQPGETCDICGVVGFTDA